MARLTIDQIKAPDLSVASAATTRAGESFQQGVSNASDLLSKYQTGLEERGDAELTGLLAGAKNEDEWNSVLDSTDFSKLTISPAMRQQIIDRRTKVLGYDKDRASIAGTEATTNFTNNQAATELFRPAKLRADTNETIANTAGIRVRTDIASDVNDRAGVSHAQDIRLREAAEGRTVDDYGRKVDKYTSDLANTNAENALGDDTAQARYDQWLRGKGLSSPASDTLSAAVSPSNGGSTVPTSPVVSKADVALRSAAGEFTPAVIDPKKAQELNDAYDMPEHNFPDASVQTYREEFPDLENKIKAWSESQYGETVTLKQYMDSNGIRKLYQSHRRSAVGGNSNIETPTGGDANSTISVAGSSATPPNTRSDSQIDQDYVDSILRAKNLTASQRDNILGKYLDSVDSADTKVKQADTVRFNEELASVIQKASEQFTNPVDAANYVKANIPEGTKEQRLAAYNAAGTSAQDGGQFSAAILKFGLPGLSSEDQGMATSLVEDLREKQLSDPNLVAYSESTKFEDDPVTALTAALKGFSITAKTADIDAAINWVAEKAEVTRGQAAWAYARAAGGEWAINRTAGVFGDNLSNYTAKDLAETHFSKGLSSESRRTLADSKLVLTRLTGLTDRLGGIEERIQKTVGLGKTVPASMITSRDEARKSLVDFIQTYRPQNK
jgi:hypothetical protein